MLRCCAQAFCARVRSIDCSLLAFLGALGVFLAIKSSDLCAYRPAAPALPLPAAPAPPGAVAPLPAAVALLPAAAVAPVPAGVVPLAAAPAALALAPAALVVVVAALAPAAAAVGHRGLVQITPFFDLVLAWNTGISYGWFSDSGPTGQVVLVAIKAIAVVALAIWMAKSETRLATIGLGLIIGGAIGNAIDRFAYGAVVDFALLHVEIAGKTYNWYVFNLADVAIVAGVAALLYDSFFTVPAAKAP